MQKLKSVLECVFEIEVTRLYDNERKLKESGNTDFKIVINVTTRISCNLFKLSVLI